MAKKNKILDTVKKCYKALDDKKAMDLKVLDVANKSSITNYLIIATATSEPHMKALANEVDKLLSEMGIQTVGKEVSIGSGWAVVDAFDFMIHIFLKDQRGLYSLEALWRDATTLKF